MNPNTATNEELRDWLIEKTGWTKHVFEDENGSSDWYWKNGDRAVDWYGHPIPNTIDAAAKCLPEGWKLLIHELTMKAYRGSWATFVTVDRTSDEATDRFRLAVKAIMAMEDGK